MLFTLDELASYPGTEGIPPATAELLRDLTFGLIYELVPAEVAEASTLARSIALEATARAYRNPNGYASETVDDYTYRRPTVTASSGVYLTADERSQLLALSTTTARPRVRSVRLRSWSVPET